MSNPYYPNDQPRQPLPGQLGQPSPGQPPRPYAPQPGPGRSKKWPWIAGIAIALVVLIGLIGAVGSDDDEQTTAAAPSNTRTAVATSTISAAEFRAESEARAAAAERERQAREAEAARLAAIEAAKLDPSTYESISSRDFALLTKNPDASKGRKLVVYGIVTQFDSATGTTSFRAETGSAPGDRYDYDQNTVVTAGDSNVVANVVEDDFVTMYVEVVGSYSYTTTMGGTMTVPKFQANVIEVTGSAA
ncbi:MULTISPECIES: DUF2510 domain-containing protein [Rhodococcus]|jgi:hypothetical protein|uniref:DUF2510 domain-containing protein n=1 Tax=Rhodococcus TaxID=1827 RepID=UPI0024B65EF1|nr:MULTISPECIES: DUF2510 domain-containing protein [Rhodococcus]MDI9973091.1 DUF2510 domain-containing protein [Rhodococcus sp. IEGM 1307]MDJ0412860.1 DUF2510 domain-containing protein [Rhodococcus opacus]